VNVCRGDFEGAIKASDEIVTLDQDIKTFLMINKAHALIFLDKIEEAKALYKKAINDSNKDVVIKGLESDIKDFKKLNFPADKIAYIEEILDLIKIKKVN
jgi:tetratricopeptide (TPR) repeat protein